VPLAAPTPQVPDEQAPPQQSASCEHPAPSLAHVAPASDVPVDVLEPHVPAAQLPPQQSASWAQPDPSFAQAAPASDPALPPHAADTQLPLQQSASAAQPDPSFAHVTPGSTPASVPGSVGSLPVAAGLPPASGAATAPGPVVGDAGVALAQLTAPVPGSVTRSPLPHEGAVALPLVRFLSVTLSDAAAGGPQTFDEAPGIDGWQVSPEPQSVS
jgi:hypothetical protein